MGLSCYCGDTDGADWWWYGPQDEAPLGTKRSRKCRSCGAKIGVGDIARKVRRFRPPTEFEETRGIHGDEVPLADWFLCEECGDLADSIEELGFCYNLGGESLKDQINECRAEEALIRHQEAIRAKQSSNAKVQAAGEGVISPVAPGTEN